jgi:hypothetical protein
MVRIPPRLTSWKYSIMQSRTLLLVAALAAMAIVPAMALDGSPSAPSSSPKQTPAKYVKLFLKPSKEENAVDFGAFVMPVHATATGRLAGANYPHGRAPDAVLLCLLSEWPTLLAVGPPPASWATGIRPTRPPVADPRARPSR